MQIIADKLKFTQVAKLSHALKPVLESCLNQDRCALFGRRLNDDELREILCLMFSEESGNRKIAFRSGALSKTVFDICFKGNPARRELFEAEIDALYPELGNVIRKDPPDPRRK
jgi:hypothetical protein